MLIVKEQENGNLVSGQIWELFPDTSFPETGPNGDWYAENKCYKVNMMVTYDPETEILVNVTPYIVDGWAYLMRAVPKDS